MRKDDGFNFSAIDRKWQKLWDENNAFKAHEKEKDKLYCLEMFPYPSASGLHIGHSFNYVIGDIYARFKRMQGANVLHPMGFDAFGLPAENAAIKENAHPRKYTEAAIKNFVKQQKSLGLSYDWSRMINTSEPDYYKWDQYFFLKFFEKGLVYRKKAPVNWCPQCRTVLANEQVHQGKCWRHAETEVEVKKLEQWFIRISDYAEELLSSIDKLDWPERIKIMQRNWIGKSTGAEVIFSVNEKKWKIFTTRADTIFGVTFMVVSAQHPELMELVSEKQRREVEVFLKKMKSTKQKDFEQNSKEGVFTGSYAVHPLTNERVPIYASNFVIADYGSGMVMAVPAHDQRDFQFAKKYCIPIKAVIQPEGRKIDERNMHEAYEGSGILINSEGFDGLFSEEAKVHVVRALEFKKMGRENVEYKIRDWLISRQRYWGAPIPVVYCDECGIVPVPEKELPVALPENVVFGEGNPLATNENFIHTKCPKCSKKARRETDTIDTFFDSSWYFLRYCDPRNSKAPFDKRKAEYWMPVDMYIGGAEHACMHLIYARFFTKVLRDLGFVRVDEPFPKLFNQGMVHGEDGFVMSKSRGNVVEPMETMSKYGADALRFFLVSMGSPDKDSVWSSTGAEGSYRFIKRVYDYFCSVKTGASSRKVESKLHNTIKLVGNDIESFRYNLAVIKLRELFESFEDEIAKKDLEIFILMLSPFCPHLAEELWEKIGNNGFASLRGWPIYDESKIDKKFEEAEKAVEKTVSDILNILKIVKEKKNREAEKVYLYAMPFELEHYDSEVLSRRAGRKVKVFAVNDKKKYDPEGKAAKAKLGKPGIYVE